MDQPDTRALRCPRCGAAGGMAQSITQDRLTGGWSWLYRCYSGECGGLIYAVSTTGVKLEPLPSLEAGAA